MSPLATTRQYAYYVGWFFKAKLGMKRPLVTTMIVHYRCNLKCQHCSISANSDKVTGPSSLTWDQASDDMKREFKNGARILFFEGGEPTLWSDRDRNFPDLIAEGRKIGYYVIGYTTNGIGDIYETSDVISISLDGPKDVHDAIRGPGTYDKMMENLSRTKHPNIFANMVVMRPNLDMVRETVELVSRSPRIKGIMLNFLTPPPYDLALSHEEKVKVVDQALAMKAEGLPVLNTEKALKELLIEDYSSKCPYWVSSFTLPDGSKHNGCPMRNTPSCKDCGFDAVREYRLIVAGNIETVTKMSKRFAVSGQEE